MISQDLLNILVCPACKGKLYAIDDGLKLLCQSCGLAFPVKNDIPVLLLDAAVSITEQESAGNAG